jgi:hypothetical protein
MTLQRKVTESVSLPSLFAFACRATMSRLDFFVLAMHCIIFSVKRERRVEA